MATKFAKKQIDDGCGMKTSTPKAELSGKLVYMFLTGMVKNKIGYVIREICKNAWEVGPFEVRLPTEKSPELVVRDFGPGLSDHFMMNRYPKMGDSTKDAEGVNGMSGFGAGSKSPLAYLFEDGMGGAYSVESIHRGVKRFYTINLNETGHPQITRMAEVETDEPSGLCVTVPVRQEDIYAFRDQAADILWSFEPRPKVTPDPRFKDPKVIASGDGWAMFDESSVPWYGPQVRAGCVMYPIDTTGIDTGGFIESDDCVVFDVDPDSIEVTSSRESLQYTSGTKSTLSKLFTNVRDEYINGLQEAISAAPNYFMAHKVFHDSVDCFSRPRKLSIMRHLTWNGLHLHESMTLGKAMVLNTGWSEFDRFYNNDSVYPWNIASHKIVVEHHPYRSLERFRSLGLLGQPILWLRRNKAELDSMIERFGLNKEDITILDEAKLEASGVTRPKRGKTVRVRRYLDIRETAYTVESTIDKADFDLAEGGYFISKGYGWRKHEFSFGGRYMSHWSVNSILHSAKALGLITEMPRLMIPNQDDDLNDKWFDYGAHLVNLMRENCDLSKIKQSTGVQEHHIPDSMRIDYRYINLSKAPSDVLELIADVKALRAEISERNKVVEDRNYKIYRLMSQVTSVQLPPPEEWNPIPALTKRWQNILSNYPLLQMALRSHDQKAIDHYFELLTRKPNEAVEEITPIEVVDEDADDDITEDLAA